MTAAAVENLQINVFIIVFLCLLARKGLQNQEVEIYLSYIELDLVRMDQQTLKDYKKTSIHFISDIKKI